MAAMYWQPAGMPTHLAFLRAANVSPRWVKMDLLRNVLQQNAFDNVETYIQSGNIRVTTARRSPRIVGEQLERVIEQEFGFPVPCLMRSPHELRDIASYAEQLTSPFPGEDVRRYVTLCSAPVPGEAAATLDAWDRPGERLMVHGSEVHWWLTVPTHQARISNARLEKLVGTATTRDLKVIRALADRWGT